MIKVGEIKISEISKITGASIPLISRYFKKHGDDKVTRINNRVVGVSPEAAEEYLRETGHEYFFGPSITLSANLCGGVGKTTGIYSLGAATRRIVSRDTPIVYVDGDSQGSFTELVFGRPADNSESILIDFLEGKAQIDDVLTDMGNNVWFVKSNLNQVYIEKVLSKPQEIKKGMLGFYEAIFKRLGANTKIFQDHTPQLSNLFASSICALSQLDNNIHKCVVIPIRGDTFAISGGEKIISEISELKDTFSLSGNIDIHCYFSSVDRRLATTADAFKLIATKESIIPHLSDAVVRYSQELPKSVMALENIYTSGKSTNATEDYQNLLQHIFKPRFSDNGAARSWQA
jgi:cellulose biosynthesis protein BcsQ